MTAADPAWQSGLSYLKRTQKPDGSWLVRSRLHEQRLVSPPYFESGFPYGANQMVSCMGTSWATAALLLATDAASTPQGQEHIDAATVTAPGAPWMETALFGTDGELKALLDGGLDPNSSSEAGTSLLMMAAGDSAKVRLLLERGANVNARAATGFTALMVAANAGATRSVQALLDRGAVVRVPEPAALFNASPAFFSVFSGQTETLDLLAARGADITQKMSMVGQSPVRPLDAAVLQRDVPMMRDLVRRGVNLNADDPDAPVSALSLAVFANDVPMAKALIELGADVNKVDSVGLTALLHAVSVDFGDVEMVRVLLAAGASPALRSKTNASAEELAERYGHRDFLPLLRRH
jgi:ankyrin repeat protein